MLKIAAIRATLGKNVTAKSKNNKDDQERVIEFTLSHWSLTQQQISSLVACNEHERPFAAVAFVSKDSISELRHFKKMELGIEVHDAVLSLDRIGTTGEKLKLSGCSMKAIELSFSAAERCEMSCKVWAPLEEHALYTLGAWGSQDLFVGVTAQRHGEDQPDKNNVLPFNA